MARLLVFYQTGGRQKSRERDHPTAIHKGTLIDVREDTVVWGRLECLPDFVSLDVPGADPADFKYLRERIPQLEPAGPPTKPEDIALWSKKNVRWMERYSNARYATGLRSRWLFNFAGLPRASRKRLDEFGVLDVSDLTWEAIEPLWVDQLTVP